MEQCRQRPSLVDEHVGGDGQERQRERQPRDDGGHQELGREQAEHDRGVAATQPQGDE
jgi:hypothetical protein